jgi:hypothetical protein
MINFRAIGVAVFLVLLPMVASGCKGCRQPAPLLSSDTSPASSTADSLAVTAVDPLAGQDEAPIAAQTAVRCEADDAREVVLPDGTIVEMDEKTELVINRADQAEGDWVVEIALHSGAIRLDVPPMAGKRLAVRTPVAVAGVRGTEFAVAHDDRLGTEIDVFDGRVSASAAGKEAIVPPDRAAVTTRHKLRLTRVRDEVHRRWENARARVADKLIERCQLDIEGDARPDLDEVLRLIPQTVRERARQRMQERIEERRRVLRAALRDVADTIDRQSMTAQERFEAARRNWIQKDTRRREVFRERVHAAQERWQRGLEDLADTMARMGADDAAARLRDSARRSEADMQRLSDTMARTGHVAPEFIVTVGPPEGSGSATGERRLLAKPAPSLPGNHPLIREEHTLRYRLQIGPAGAVRDVQFISATISREASMKVDPLLRLWRFNADLERKPEWRTVTITTVPR